jgi:hypothetical protein
MEIMQKLGVGEVMRIGPAPRASFQWKYRGQEVQWNVHYAVVKEGRVLHAWTGRKGESLAEYMEQWEDAVETTVTSFGMLSCNEASDGFTFAPFG